MLLARDTVLEIQLRSGPHEEYCAKHDEPQLPECNSESEEHNRTRHCERPDGAWREEAEHACAIFNLCLFPVFRNNVHATLGDVEVDGEHEAERSSEN